MANNLSCPPFLIPSRFTPSVSPPFDVATLAQQGLLFQASTGDVDVPVAGGKLFLVLANPAGSGRSLQVFGVGADQYSIFSDLFVQNNPDYAAFTPVAIQSTNAAAPLVPVAVAYSGTEAPPPDTPPNGILLARNLAAAPWLMNAFVPGLWVVPPGNAIGFIIYFYASSSAYYLGAISVVWGEIPISVM